MKLEEIDDVIKILKMEYKQFREPIVTQIAKKRKDPFRILISTVLSLRTKDDTTSKASKRLFKVADNPYNMIRLSKSRIMKLIYPVGFYRTKANNILSICSDLINRYNEKVPDEIDELLKLKGVGRKTANLVVTLGYGKKGICVDTHVHRISNRLGFVKTKSPDKTEMALRDNLPVKHWIIYNDLLVSYGQNLCKPISPHCSICKIYKYCERVGVNHSR